MYQVLFYHATLRYQFLCKYERYHCKITIFFIFSTISLACINVLKCLEMFEMQYILAIKLQMKYFGVSEILSHMYFVSVHLFYNSHALCTCNLIQEVHVCTSCFLWSIQRDSCPKSGILVKTNTCTCNFHNLS